MLLNTLQGQHIKLEPLIEEHRAELYKVAQDETIWTYNAVSGFGANFHSWFDGAISELNKNHQHAYAVRRLQNNELLGSTRFYEIDNDHRRLKIGYTWLVPSVWGTLVNAECKYLLMKFAFEEMMVNRIELMTDARNLRSRFAIKKLGATEEGILRQHIVLKNGYIRDSVVHSIIRSEWPEVKLNLERRLVVSNR